MLNTLETPVEETRSGDSQWTREITDEVGSPTLCSHAFSVGETVFRIADDTNAVPWWTWQKIVEPGSIVTHLSCNTDGSVIVAATDIGTVALLRGCDGRRLAYQQVSVTNVQWISEESLWIETDNAIILVNHINGQELNHETDERAVSRATRLLEMTNVSLRNLTLRAFTILPSQIVVACGSDGDLLVLEIQNKELAALETQPNVPIVGEIDYGLGFHLLDTSGVSIVVGSSLQQSDRIIFWFDTEDNSIACTYTIPDVVVADALQPLGDSVQGETSAITLAVATRVTSGAQIHILQVLVDGETVANPHSLYCLSETERVIGMTIAPIPTKDCSLRYRIWTKSGGPKLKAFQPNQTQASKLRRVRSLLAKKEVGLITDDLVAGLDGDAFSKFHSSEIVFAKLCIALSEHNGAAAVSELLRKLIHGAKTSDDGLGWLIRGIRHVIQTPSNFTLQQFHAGVGLLTRLVEPLTAVLSKPNEEKLRALLRTVGRKAQALEYLIENKVETTLSFCEVRSIRHLYEVLVRELRIDSAKALAAKDLISLEDLVLPILHTRPQSDMAVLSLLRDSIFPRLSINDDIVSRIKQWAVKFAEKSDDIEQSVEVLEIIHAELSLMHDRIHSCFGNYSPFVADLGEADGRTNLFSDASSVPDMSESNIDDTKIEKRSKAVISRAGFPTILQQSKSVAMRLTRLPVDEQTSEAEDDIILKKLTEAKCIRDARELGLVEEFTNLRRFEGVGSVAKQLCRSLGQDRLVSDLLPFCRKYDVNFNLVLDDNIGRLCRGKDVSEASILEACSLVYLCLTAVDKCNAALVVLRAARVFGTPHSKIFQLADKSTQWATGDQSIKEELSEARRLLQIDAIIIKYCGDTARNMFRLDDPRHSLRLFRFVCDHGGRTGGVVGDALSMCHAFNHISEIDAAVKILESALLRQKPDSCASLFDELLRYNRGLATRALMRTILTAEIVAKYHESTGYVEAVYDCVSSLVMTARENGLSLNSEITACVLSLFEHTDLREMRERLVDIVVLRRSNSVNSTLQMLRKETDVIQILTKKVAEVVEESAQISEKDLKVLKRMCVHLSSRKTVASNIWAVSIATVASSLVQKPQSTKFIYSLLKSAELLTTRQPNAVHTYCQSVIAVSSIKSAILNSFVPETTIERAMLSLAIVTDYTLRQASFGFIRFSSTFAESLGILKRAMEKCDGTVASLPGLFFSKYSGYSPSHLNNPICSHQTPRLHDSWYVGDGILLPPNETLECALAFLVGRWQGSRGSPEMASLLAAKGTHFFELHILCQASSMLAFCSSRNEEARLALVQDQLEDSVKAIAERSLGGTGYGVTSSVIDSQNALSCLLEMDVKDAFSIFKVCIPMAIKRQSYSRLHILACIGVMASAASNESSSLDTLLPHGIGWANQGKFNDQCVTLAEKATWWNVLSENGIEFDSKLFDSEKRTHAESEDLTYAESMLLVLISRLASSELNYSQVLQVCGRYAKPFHLKGCSPAACMIEHLLRPVTTDEVPFFSINCKRNDVRYLLAQMKEPGAALSVLRRCVRKIEQSEKRGHQYELLGVTLGLYHEILTSILGRDKSWEIELPASLIQVYEEEKGLIENRLGVLSVLSAFYHGNRRSGRPSFNGFFISLPHRIKESPFLQTSDACQLMSLHPAKNKFDPLSSITPSLAYLDMASVSALSPICPPLGLPPGFLHARWLMEQFEIAIRSDSELPRFDDSVQPILNRLPLTLRTELAGWCFSKYRKTNTNDKLRSFEALLECKVQASATAEEHSNLTGRHDIEAEQTSMEQLAHMTSLKDSLSRVLAAKAVLLENGPKSSKVIVQLCVTLAHSLDKEITEKPNMGIDDIVEFILSCGSDLAAERCLTTSGFTLQHFRFFSDKVHHCCREISEYHDERARDLANQWLFYGDEKRLQDNHRKPQLSPLQIRQKSTEDAQEDFVMDISEVQNSVDWKSVEGAVPRDFDKFIAEEEKSSIEACTLREKSEISAQRASLRIAFVMAFSASPPESAEKSKENLNTRNPALSRMPMYLKDKPGLDDICELHGKFLMGIVFAKSQLSTMETIAHSIPKDVQTITFAMRHRALRVASILCPHDILGEISPTCTLRKVCFGVFVAKEVEEMGLTLPHSDLVQLSSMNFDTYARTLWMQHRKDDLKSQGRFLLLLCEMILQEAASLDANLLALLDEIVRRRLPRTLLLVLDRVSSIALSSSLDNGSITAGIDVCLANVSKELSQFTPSMYTEQRKAVVSALNMIDNILKRVSDKKVQELYMKQLVETIESSGGDVDSLCSSWRHMKGDASIDGDAVLGSAEST